MYTTSLSLARRRTTASNNHPRAAQRGPHRSPLPKLDSKSFVIYWLPVVLWVGVIAIESTALFSSANTGSFVEPILHWLFPSLSWAEIEHIHHLGRKVGHFTGYGILSYLLFRAARGTYHAVHGTADALRRKLNPAGSSVLWQSKWMFLALAGTFLVASADEIHQMYMPSRTGTWWDVLLDTTGGVIFLCLTRFAALRKSRRAT